jgi:hypothetical protein
MNVGLLFPEYVGFIDDFLSIISILRNAYAPIGHYDLSDVFTFAQSGHTTEFLYVATLPLAHRWFGALGDLLKNIRILLLCSQSTSSSNQVFLA